MKSLLFIVKTKQTNKQSNKRSLNFLFPSKRCGIDLVMIVTMFQFLARFRKVINDLGRWSPGSWKILQHRTRQMVQTH